MLKRELKFLFALWQANLLAAMEYRVAFISQMLGMMLNNVVYFMYWVVFFDRFNTVNGWVLSDMLLLFGIVASGVGLGVVLFGNVTMLSEVISGGRLDYYLSLPRPVLIHVLASRSSGSGYGDFLYGLISFFFAGQLDPGSFVRFIFGVIISMTIFVSFLVIAHSLAFWVGNASMIGQQAMNAIITFSIYPITLFDGTAKLILLTIIPAAFVGAIPAEFVRAFSWGNLFQLLFAAAGLLGLSILIFSSGLKRYESGSAIQVRL
ncbi:MAG: ABC-2 family transporter protein [Chloroflexota bacterium]